LKYLAAFFWALSLGSRGMLKGAAVLPVSGLELFLLGVNAMGFCQDNFSQVGPMSSILGLSNFFLKVCGFVLEEADPLLRPFWARARSFLQQLTALILRRIEFLQSAFDRVPLPEDPGGTDRLWGPFFLAGSKIAPLTSPRWGRRKAASMMVLFSSVRKILAAPPHSRK
jgi:hypothetical protein